MPVESATYISDLNSSNPPAGDGLNQADDHLRLIKSSIKTTFPNIAGAVTADHTELNKLDGLLPTTAELNFVDGVTSAIQTQLDGKQPLDADLTALAGLTSAADRLPYFTGSGTAALAVFTSAARDLLDDANAAAMRSTLGVVSATDAAAGLVELATDAETQTGTDTARAITPANLTAKEATAAQYRNNTADRLLTTDEVWTAAGRVSLSWSSGGTTAVDLNSGLNFTLAASAGNSTLGAPTNAKTGQSGFIEITQDSTPRTLAFASAWHFDGGSDPALSTASGAKDVLYYTVLNSTGPVIHATLRKDVK